MNRRTFLRAMLGSVGLTFLGGWKAISSVWAERSCARIVVLGDPHLPVRLFQNRTEERLEAIQIAKEKVLEDINGWSDVTAVVGVGDIVAWNGVPEEYDYCTQYFGRLRHPWYLINGNHDYFYKSSTEKLSKGSRKERLEKLDTFRKTFHLPGLYYSKDMKGYHLVFLAVDGMKNLIVEIGEEQLSWLREDLSSHREKPTILFFHAPLMGTLPPYHPAINTPTFTAQPEFALECILRENPQVRFWVSGHTHTPETQPGFADNKVNAYLHRIVNIHNPTMDRLSICTNSLYLYKDHVKVRTYNHRKHQWIGKLDRSFSL